MRAILECVDSVFEEWSEPHTLRLPKGPEQLILANIFKSAVAL